MPRFKVTLCARAQVEVDLEIEAATQEEAERLALQEAGDQPDCCWAISEGFVTDPEVLEVEPIGQGEAA